MHREIGAYRTKNLGHNQKWLTSFFYLFLFSYLACKINAVTVNNTGPKILHTVVATSPAIAG